MLLALAGGVVERVCGGIEPHRVPAHSTSSTHHMSSRLLKQNSSCRTSPPCTLQDGCIQADGSVGPCYFDDGGFGYGHDGRLLGGLGITTTWIQGSVVETGWSLRSNHGGGYSFRLCKKPADGNYTKVTEECFAKQPLDFVGDSSFIQYSAAAGGARVEIDAVRTSKGTRMTRTSDIDIDSYDFWKLEDIEFGRSCFVVEKA